MARDSSEAGIRMPFLYALLDDEPERASEPRQTARALVRRFRESVRMDLQNLLNTRERSVSWSKDLTELNSSVLNYGVRDVTGANLSSGGDRDRFLKELANTVRRNDSRFRSVEIHSLDNADPLDRTLRFRIEARISVEAGTDSTTFDFQLEPVSRHFE